MNYYNEMNLHILAVSENESFARAVVGAFCLPLKPSLEDIADIKTAVSEAVTNSVVHAYPNKKGYIDIHVAIKDCTIAIEIKDYGVGIVDVQKAKQPFFTSLKNSERSGMGFTVMEGFMDQVTVDSIPGQGTTVRMQKTITNLKTAFGG